MLLYFWANNNGIYQSHYRVFKLSRKTSQYSKRIKRPFPLNKKFKYFHQILLKSGCFKYFFYKTMEVSFKTNCFFKTNNVVSLKPPHRWYLLKLLFYSHLLSYKSLVFSVCEGTVITCILPVNITFFFQKQFMLPPLSLLCRSKAVCRSI